VPVAAQASDGTITFKGKLVSTTCTISVNGGSNSATVSLPTVATTALTSAGQIAGGTRFSIVLSACSKQTGSAVAYFEPGDGVNSADNNLRNTETTTPAGNVEVQLTNLTGTPIKIGDKASQEAMSTGTPPTPLNGATIVNGAATLSYVASYYATGQSTTGAVTASVTYSIDYF